MVTVKLLFYSAIVLQALAILYAIYLMKRRQGLAAWLWLLGSMLSMMTWRIVVATGVTPPAFFNPLIAIWGSTCLCVGMFYFGLEIARRERAEAERDALLESERAARAQVEHAARVKDQFLATLSHELRTPLTAIIGWCDIYRLSAQRGSAGRNGGSDGTGWDGDEAIATIDRNARLQARLIEDLLDVTRINSGTLRLDAKPVTLGQAIRGALETVRPLAHAKRLRLVVSIDDSLQVMGDALRLQQVVWNLLTNAIKFTPEDGTVHVTCAADRDHARLAVSDTGEGIAADFLPHLFTRFRQSDEAVSKRRGGLGLGLSIVKSLVELHGGSVKAQSDGPGRGATFTVLLPLVGNGGGDAVSDGAGDSPLNSTASLNGVRVLVVDDERDMRVIAQRILAGHGAVVVPAASAEEASRLLRGQKFDVIVSDIGMPVEDGYAFLRRIRAEGDGTPAIALTAYARDTDRGKAMESGFHAHVAKPVDAGELVSEVMRLVRGRGAAVRDGHSHVTTT